MSRAMDCFGLFLFLSTKFCHLRDIRLHVGLILVIVYTSARVHARILLCCAVQCICLLLLCIGNNETETKRLRNSV